MLSGVSAVLLTAEEISDKVSELGRQISKDYAGKDLLLISVLKGSVVFFADLIRAVNIPLTIDFLAVSSYGNSTETSGEIKILKDLDCDISKKNIIIIEDILDSGRTLSYIMNLMEGRGAASVEICVLLDKPERRAKGIAVEGKYTGFRIPDEFVVGYGLDYAEQYRNLPYIGVIKPEE